MTVLIIGFSLRSDMISGESKTLPRTAFVHLFEWQWDDIARECETFLGPQGFAAVQISPPNEHAVVAEQGFPWWQRYQPVSYKLQSRSGDRTQLANMIQRCHQAGVKVYADAVINHMTAQESGVGSAGTPFIRYHYADLYQPSDFHSCDRNIRDYTNRDEVMNCQLVGLPDLKTSSPKVQQRIVEYLISLLNLGVDGFRIDAAKHMESQDIAAILALLDRQTTKEPYIYQEVIDPGNEAIKKTEYYPNGDVIEFEYGKKVGAKFMGIEGQTIAQLETLGESWGLMPSNKAIVFIDNHDKQRGHGGGGTYLTHQDPELYDLANVFMLAFPYGYPQVMSSYRFTNSDQGPPADANGKTHPVYRGDQAFCFGEWVCEHRYTAIAPMIQFRNITTDTAVTHWWSNGNNQIAFGRGDKGFVVINREDTVLTHTFQTDLPQGTYCNILKSEVERNRRTCGDRTQAIAVNAQGQATITALPMEAVAIHVGAKVS
ncbi:alpha-amylase [Oscillatoria sp. FACHB-1407]|uniref:alpha-amylase n=1 Tax=Oscillatoria sp. FACHB-1407 TaxID=2692847 RepID=UPI0018F00F7D|nr:alpha-amylase family protein [Oscillatoria sp. FACHB-1407]